jgi:glycosyltransferase involved in cell wall biosynthesis
LKILQLIDSLSIGGAERMAVNMANAFADNKIENALVCTRTSGPLEKFVPENTKFFELRKGSSLDLIAFISLIRIINSVKPEIIHAHSTSIYWGIALKFFRPSTKLIWHDHDGNRKFERNFWLKLVLNFSNALVVVNQDLLEWSMNEIPNKKVALIVNFPYLNLRIDEKKRREMILHLANLRHPKDHLILIDAARILKTRNKLNFKICCAGNDNDDEYSNNLKNRIREYDLENEIDIIGAVNDTGELLTSAAIGVLCSSSEGLPVSLLEYGLAALPVVVTNVGQCAEVVGHGKFGTVVAASNPRKLADALEWHIQNRADSINLGAKFKQHVEENYGSQRFIKDYQKMLNDL